VVHQATHPIDAYANLRIETLTLQIESFYMRKFMDDVLAHPDLRLVLATPIRREEKEVRLLVEVVQPIAQAWRDNALDVGREADAVYAATILHAIDYLMFPALCGKYGTPHVLYAIAKPHLAALISMDARSGNPLQTCMRWDEFDEEAYLSEWLGNRMNHALKVLELAAF